MREGDCPFADQSVCGPEGMKAMPRDDFNPSSQHAGARIRRSSVCSRVTRAMFLNLTQRDATQGRKGRKGTENRKQSLRRGRDGGLGTRKTSALETCREVLR